MSDDLTAKEVATTFAKAARTIYERAGHLAPAVHILDIKGAGLSMIPNTVRFGGEAREQLAALVALAADAVDTVFICTCVEAWTKAFPPSVDGELPDLERGQLQRESEQDATIQTSLVVHAIDVRDPAQSYNIMATVTGDPRDHTFDVHEADGIMPGAFVDIILRAYNSACLGRIPLPESATGSLENRLTFLAGLEFISAATATTASLEGNTDG